MQGEEQDEELEQEEQEEHANRRKKIPVEQAKKEHVDLPFTPCKRNKKRLPKRNY